MIRSWLSRIKSRAERGGDALVRQKSPGECGLACIAMVLSTLDEGTSIADLRLRYPTLRNGMTFRELLGVCVEHGLRGRAVHCPTESLGKLNTPCILHWDMAHFVVLLSNEAGRFVVLDPSSGRETYDLDRIGLHYCEVALELSVQGPAIAVETTARATT